MGSLLEKVEWNMPRNNYGLLILVSLLFVSSACSPLSAGSLWLQGRDLYSTQAGKEYKPGDIITVIISEETTAQSAATTNTQADTSMEVKSDPPIPFFNPLVKKFIGKNQVTNSRKGNGTTTRSGKLAGTVTASVLEVLPNGNLLIEGRRSMRVNKETEIMRVRGIARPQDIDSKNSVNSKALADAEIKYEGKGAVGSTQRPGIFTKISNFLF